MNEISICEVCDNKGLKEVIDLGAHPLCDDLVKVATDRICKEYPIEILYCEKCHTCHQKYQVPKTDLFTPEYHYRARMTGSVLVGMKDLVDSTENCLGNLAGKLVLDIGCNDGSLLNFFEEKGCKTVGIEPTGAWKDSKHPTLNAYFDKTSATEILEKYGNPDIITFTNVFAHIEDLKGLIENLKILMGKDTTIVIENHYLGDILKRGQFDTFYHEHPRTYSHKSFEYIAKSLGLNVVDVQFVSRYGGNIRVFMKDGETKISEVNESDFEERLVQLSKEMEDWKVKTKKLITEHVASHGKLRAKAFPGRAAILIKLLELDEKSISAVYEIKGSIKVGHYVPGTRIPILPEAELYKLDKTEPILNLAWHIPAEVRANLESHGYVGKVIDIKENEF